MQAACSDHCWEIATLLSLECALVRPWSIGLYHYPSPRLCAAPFGAAPAGTMLFGESTSPQEAAALLAQAAEAGVNFFDSAEMYPVPQRAGTQGASEAILGSWLRGRRR